MYMTDTTRQMEYEGGIYEFDVDSLPVIPDPEAFVQLSPDEDQNRHAESAQPKPNPLSR
jgi:hypothetical protein